MSGIQTNTKLQNVNDNVEAKSEASARDSVVAMSE